jgi:hypothetical protein
MEALLLLIAIAPAILTYALRRTALFWLPGAALVVLGIVAFGSISDTHGDVGGIGAMANGVMAIAGMLALGYAGLCLLLGGIAYGRASRSRRGIPQHVEFPTATVISDMSDRGRSPELTDPQHGQSWSSWRNAK